MSTEPSSHLEDYKFFLMQVPELLQTLEQELLALESEFNLNKIHQLMRTAHTIKGAAAAVGLETLKRIAHSLEDVFKAFYNPSAVMNAEIKGLLFQVYECLRLLLNAELSNTPLNESRIFNRAVAVFTQLQQKLGDCSEQSIYPPTAAELGFDLQRSLLETDVKERLVALESTLAEPDLALVGQMLRKHAGVLVGLAEALNFSALGTIAQNALTALDAHPEQVKTIAQTTVHELRRLQGLQGLASNSASEKTASPEAGIEVHTPELSQAPIDLSDLSALAEILNEMDEESSDEDSRGIVTKVVSGSAFTPASQSTKLASDTALATGLTTSAQAVKLELEKLEHLRHLAANLLMKQTQQGTVNEQLQQIVLGLQEQIQQHQQTLSRICNTSQSESGIELERLLQSALEETMDLAKAMLEIAILSQESNQALEEQQQLLTNVQDDLKAALLCPLSEVLNRLPRILQQLVVVYGKPAELKLSGTEILVDKTIAEKLYDPLLQLIRNAFDHGLELPDTRRQLGKPAIGRVSIHAYQRDNSTFIEVSDDGKGLDWAGILEQAVESDALPLEQIVNLSEEQLIELLFEPNFSTASQVSELSGRGMGLNIVRVQLQAMQGSISVRSELQRGTTFVLRIPHTLTMQQLNVANASLSHASTLAELHPLEVEAISDPKISEQQERPPKEVLVSDAASNFETIERTIDSQYVISHWKLKTNQFFVWQAGMTIFVLPYENIEEYLPAEITQVIQVQQQRFLHWREQMIPYYQLSELLQSNCTLAIPTETRHESVITLVLKQGSQLLALESTINCLVTGAELSIHPFSDAIALPSFLYGCLSLQEDELMLVVSVPSLLSQALGLPTSLLEPVQAIAAPKVLIVDDSRTVREMLRLTLYQAGYQVLQAEDGHQAIAQLQQNRDIRLIICDAEMPNMNGFGFLNHCRRDSSLAKIPVVMLSLWNSSLNRQLARRLGVRAYFGKPYVEQELLETLKNILESSA